MRRNQKQNICEINAKTEIFLMKSIEVKLQVRIQKWISFEVSFENWEAKEEEEGEAIFLILLRRHFWLSLQTSSFLL